MPGLGPSGDNPIAQDIRRPSPGAVGPGSRRGRRRYAGPPTAALLTGLRAGRWSPLRSRPCAPFSFLFSQGPAVLAGARHPNTSRHIVSPRRVGPFVWSLGVPCSEPPCYSRSCRRPGERRSNTRMPAPRRQRSARVRIPCENEGNRNRFNGFHIMLHDVLTAFVILGRVASRAYRTAAGLSSTGSSVVGKPGNKRCHCRRWAIRYCLQRTVPRNVGR
jgi:hypothetical protein